MYVLRRYHLVSVKHNGFIYFSVKSKQEPKMVLETAEAGPWVWGWGWGSAQPHQILLRSVIFR